MNESMPKNEDERMMQLSLWDFDQSPDGWRKFAESKEYIEAANLIRHYINVNKDKISNPVDGEKITHPELIYFHLGQMLALAGPEHFPEAIESLNQAFREGGECWNSYVSATIGFLEGDEDKVSKAIQTIELSKEENKKGGNIGIVRNFKRALQAGISDYEEPYFWPRDEGEE